MRNRLTCFVCLNGFTPYFTKDFAGSYGLHEVEYWCCKGCGMVVSKTHFAMTLAEWETLNGTYHESYQGSEGNSDDLRWVERLSQQASTMAELTEQCILPRNVDGRPWLDYACGDGKLADMLAEKGYPTLKYDRYMHGERGTYLDPVELAGKGFGVVLNTSFFEHVRDITPLEEIVGLVADSGVLALHTLVAETIPQDPSWFYLLPVHCAFYTNRSMQILFDRWGFEASIYHVEARMWFWFRENGERIRRTLLEEKPRLTGEYHFKFGFMDYWK